MNRPLVSLEGIEKHFDDFIAVKNLNLTIEQGEFIAIMGTSGCGKTTTLRMLAGLETRIADRSVLKLIRMWLETPVVEEDGTGRKTGRRSLRGTPQGGVISPLLANSFLHWFDRAFHAAHGPARWADARLVRYADDCAPGNVHAR